MQLFTYTGLGKLDHRKSVQNVSKEGKTAAKPPFFLLYSLQKRHTVVVRLP
jgi:RNase P protein component